MAINTGLLISFSRDEEPDLIVESEAGGYQPFSEVYNSSNWDSGPVAIALISFGGETFDYIAIAKRGNRVVTAKYRIDFSSLVNLNSISIELIESKLEQKLRSFFLRARRTEGKISPATWLKVLNLIKVERPALASEIDRVIRLARFAGFQFNGKYAEVLALEREAIGISLDIFSGNNQLREAVLSEWVPENDSITSINETNLTANINAPNSDQLSFLSGIPTYHLVEENALQHDLMNWPDMSTKHSVGYSIFRQGERRLELIYANRNALEKTLGVDLIYFNSAFEQFVLVQYKAMRTEGDFAVYRPDPQLIEELARMNSFNKKFRRSAPISSNAQYRLNSDGFFLKLVPKATLRPATGELIKGMYLPLEYANFLVSDSGPKGPKKGSVITFKNAPRYLTNSQFSSGVNQGWLGSSGTQTEVLKMLIKQYYETGRAVVVAFENSATTAPL